MSMDPTPDSMKRALAERFKWAAVEAGHPEAAGPLIREYTDPAGFQVELRGPSTPRPPAPPKVPTQAEKALAAACAEGQLRATLRVRKAAVRAVQEGRDPLAAIDAEAKRMKIERLAESSARITN